MTTIVMTALDTLDPQQVVRPLPGPGEVVVDIRSIGICGSDAAYLHHGRIGGWIVNRPFILGHEASGVVTAVGVDIDSSLLGTRVAVEPGAPCRTCRQCTRGRYHLCPDLEFLATPPFAGCLAEQIAIRSDQVHPIPDQMSFDDAALVEPTSVGLWACKRVELAPGDAVYVTGGGPVGILAGLVARALGASRVTVSDPSPIRRAIAEDLGLRTVDSDAKWSESETCSETYDVLIECSGNEGALRSGLNHLGPAGRAALVGMPHQDDLSVPFTSLVPREISLFAVNRYAHTWPAAIELIADGRVPTAGLVTHHFDLIDTSLAFHAQAHDVSALKVMIHA